MMSKRLVWTEILHSFPHVLIALLLEEMVDVWCVVAIKLLVACVLFIGVRADLVIGALSKVVINVSTVAVRLEWSMRVCWAAFRCSKITFLDCNRVLQAWMPSYHVWSSFLTLPALPQFLNQEPPRPQQLNLPDFPMTAHPGHTELIVVVLAAGGLVRASVKETKGKS